MRVCGYSSKSSPPRWTTSRCEKPESCSLSSNRNGYRLTKGIAEYRAGQWEQAAARLSELASKETSDFERKPLALLFAAMARQRLKAHDEARKLLDQVSQIREKRPANSVLGSWLNWSHIDIVYDEAQKLIIGDDAQKTATDRSGK